VEKRQRGHDTHMPPPMKPASSHVATEKQNKELPPSSSIPRPANPVGYIRSGTPMPETPSIEGGISQPQPPPQRHPPSAQPEREHTDASVDKVLKLNDLSGWGFTDRAHNWKTLLECGGDLNQTLVRLYSQRKDATGLEMSQVKWRPQLVWLEEMGFTNWSTNLLMMERCDGDVDAAVTMLQEHQERRDTTQDPIERPKLKLKLRFADREQPEKEALEYMNSMGFTNDRLNLAKLHVCNGDVERAMASINRDQNKRMLRRELSDLDAEGEDEDAEGEVGGAEGGDIDAEGEDVDTAMIDSNRPDNTAARPDSASGPRTAIPEEDRARRSRSTWIVFDSSKSPDAGLPQEKWTTRTGKACMEKGPPSQENEFDIDAELANVRAALEALKATEAERPLRSLSHTEDRALSPGTSTEVQDSEMTGASPTSTDDAPQGTSEAALARVCERMRSIPGLVDERRDSAHSRKNSGQDSRKSSVVDSCKNSEVVSRRSSRLANQDSTEDTKVDEGQDDKAEGKDTGKRDEDEEKRDDGEDML
jgi:hypothetical protein